MPIVATTGRNRTVASRVLRLSAESRPLRRSLGPTAWAVLEEMALDANADEAGVAIAATNVRDLAEHLGVVKDTVVRALNRLIAAGVAVRRPQRLQAGRFGAVVYELRLPAGLTLSSCPEDADTSWVRGAVRKSVADPCPINPDADVVATAAVSPRRVRALRVPRAGGYQLSLLDAEGGAVLSAASRRSDPRRATATEVINPDDERSSQSSPDNLPV